MITIKIDNQMHLYPASHLPRSVAAQVRARLTFPNPAYLEAEKRGFWTGNLEREIKGYQVDGDSLIMTRGFTRQLAMLLRAAGVKFQVEDQRRTLPEVDFAFRGELRDYQLEAVEAMAARDFGTLSAPTGSGKTITALMSIADTDVRFS